MTSLNISHAEKTSEMSSKQPAPKVQVQRSASRETITIHFSAFGKEEEEEKEEEKCTESPSETLDDQSIVTALEAKEDLCFDHGEQNSFVPTTSLFVATSPTVLPTVKPLESQEFSVVPLAASPSSDLGQAPSPLGVALPSELRTSLSSSPLSSPSKSHVFSSTPTTVTSSKPFMSLVKSLSTDIEPKEPSLSTRHRQLMKTLVKSLSTDTSKQEPETVSFKPPDSKLNLHLFKQFTQPQSTGSDSKTAPSSPLTSPDTRSFFKVPEMEAKIENTKRRFSEVIYEPFQLFSKIMSDESSSHRPKALSSSASELSNLSSLNGHLESNNNYSIKEEECDSEGDFYGSNSSVNKSTKTQATEGHEKETESRSSLFLSTKDSSSKTSLVLERCCLSALASKEDEEFCELYSEDCLIEDDRQDKPVESLQKVEEVQEEISPLISSEGGIELPAPQIRLPMKTLYFLTMLIYAYLILPLPSYFSGLFLGIAIGFIIATCIIWLFIPSATNNRRYSNWSTQLNNTEVLEIEEPEIFKGWMNEIYNYDPETYHATLTHSIFVRLEGNILRLSKPNKNISRRTFYNETKPEVTYISQKIYDLTESKIYLVPKSLARKRVWNKKYPICIELGRQDDFMAKAQADKETSEEKISIEKENLSSEEIWKPAQDGAKSGTQKNQVLYLFGRTGREKEEWFRRFLVARKLKSEEKKPIVIWGNKSGSLPGHNRTNSQSGILTHSRSSSKGSVEEIVAQPKLKDLGSNIRQKILLDYNVYMARCIPPEQSSPTVSPIHSADSSPTAVKKLLTTSHSEDEEKEAWINALLGRIFWDFLGEKYWSNLVSKKIQMKLSKIKLPYFMNELTLTELDMGIALPKILQAYKPTIDYKGLWIDLEILYNGSFLMTLETKMNLTKLGKEPLGEALKSGEFGKEGFRPRAYYLADSDEESSSAGSSEEDDVPEASGSEKNLVAGAEGYASGHRTSKIMRFVDKITKSKYFQKATETEFIKKKIEEVSNTPLLLTVEVQECKGMLAINIPPPPTDRIWYGFRRPPYLELKARPKLGEREVTLVHVTEWIEKKLEQEFQKIFVMPNMDDVYIPLMHSVMDPRSSMCPLKFSEDTELEQP